MAHASEQDPGCLERAAARTALARRAADFFTQPRLPVHAEQYRSFVVFNVGMVAAFSIHLLVTLVFAAFGLVPLVAFNLISLATYAGGLQLARHGYFFTSVALATVELVVHQALAAHLIGWAAGFHYYILSVTGIVFFLPPGRWPVKVAILAGAALGFVAIGRILGVAEPVYPLSPQVLQWMHDINIVVVFFLLGIFAHYYGKAAGWAESKLIRRLELALRSADVGLWEWQVPGSEMFHSEEWKRQIGFDPADLPDRFETFADRLHPEDRRTVLDRLQACSEGQARDFHIEFRLRHRDGSYRWILSQGRGQRERTGRVSQLNGCHLDITGRKGAEEALESLARFPAEDPHPVLRVSFSGEILYANDAARRLDAGPGGSIPEGITGLARQGAAGETPLETELTVGPRTFAVRAVPFLTESYVNVYLTDISEKKKFQARMLMQQKFEAIGTLAGGIAHDFNNILSAMLGFAELSLEEVEPGSYLHDNLQEVHAASLRARELVKQILAFARQSKEETRPLEIASIIREVLKFIRATIPSTIEIKHSIRSASRIMGNPSQVHQVMMNLCTNAAQAMEARGGVLTVATKDVRVDEQSRLPGAPLDPGDYVQITVTDTGTGIPPEILGSIFEPYFTTKPPGEGTGLGLATVHGIVESCRGQITVQSTPGCGTTFHVFLPVTRASEVPEIPEASPLPRGTEKILFVDDEVPITEMSRQLLERLGYAVTTRNNGLDALELFRERPDSFDLVVTDQTMPSITGLGLAEALIARRPDIPVIVCTGYSRQVSEETAREMGIRAFLHKPITRSDLARIVRRVLDETTQGG